MKTISQIKAFKRLARNELELALERVELASSYEDTRKYHFEFTEKVNHYENKYGKAFVDSYCEAYKKLKRGDK